MSRLQRIDSQKHPQIEFLRDVQNEKPRETHAAFHVEGAMLVRRAIASRRVRFLVLTERFAASEEAAGLLESDAEAFCVTEGLMAKTIPAKPAPGVVACVDRVLLEPDELLTAQESPLIFLVDRCENPDNLGMLLRSLDAAGVDGVSLTTDGADPFNRLSVRASRGAVLSLRMAMVRDPDDWVGAARARGFRVVATSAHGDACLWDEDLTGPVVVLLGNEHVGVRESLKSAADSVCAVPVAGLMQSLNIAAAGTVAAYEAVRQRRG